MHITTKSGKKVYTPTDQEETEITRQAIEDGTLYTNEELAQFKPASEFPELQTALKPIGRPKSATTKTPISIRLSDEVVDYFKNTGKGWQTRMDEVLRDYVAHH